MDVSEDAMKITDDMRTEALKVKRHLAEVNSTCNLLIKAGYTGQGAKAKTEYTQLLADGILIYPPTLRRFGLTEKMSFIEKKQVFMPDAMPKGLTDREAEFVSMLSDCQAKTRRQNWIWRIGQETEYMAQRGWYGFFVTLTVDPSRIADPEAMWREGRELRKYLRRIARVSCAAGGQPNAIKEGQSIRNWVRHVGVIEHGKSGNHHHFHGLIWMRHIPDRWKVCPNRFVKDPRRRVFDECKEFRTFWPNSLPGIGRAKFLRHHGDPWSALGFAVPVNRKGVALRINRAEAAGNYIGKYLDKEKKAWTHRVKAVRGCGLNILRDRLLTLTARQLTALTWRPRNHDLSISLRTIHTVPTGLLRSMAKTERFVSKWASNTLKVLEEMSEPFEGFNAMLKSVRDGAVPKRMLSRQFYDWVTDHLPVPEGYCEKRLLNAHKALGLDFPVRKMNVETKKLGGMALA
jgi:hypothetical protein